MEATKRDYLAEVTGKVIAQLEFTLPASSQLIIVRPAGDESLMRN